MPNNRGTHPPWHGSVPETYRIAMYSRSPWEQAGDLWRSNRVGTVRRGCWILPLHSLAQLLTFKLMVNS